MATRLFDDDGLYCGPEAHDSEDWTGSSACSGELSGPSDADTARAIELRAEGRHAFSAAEIRAVSEEPTVTFATVRDGLDEWHVECRMSDGQKGAFVTVDREFEQLAHRIADALNASAPKAR